MSMRKMLILAALLAPLPVAAQGGDSAAHEEGQGVTDFKLEKAIDSIPIHRVPTSTAARKKQQREGRRVMLVEGRPGYLYRDFLRASVAAGPSPVAAPMLRTPQDNPDVYGCVTVSFEIRPDGKTDAFEIEKSEPAGVFDKLALRSVYQTEYQPLPAGEAAAKQRHERSIWFLVARPPRSEFSKVNKAVEDSRNQRREELREACEGQAS